MDISELDLAKRTLDLLHGAELHTVADVQAAGREGLIAIDGIGPKTAGKVLAAVKNVFPGGIALVADSSPELVALPSDPVTVRNNTDAAILVGHRWLFPDDVRTVRRFQLVPGLVEI